MNYHNITKEDMLNGDGIRVVLWVSGCDNRCNGCHNPITWDKEGGLPFDKNAENELFEALSRPYVEGITFSGGDPMMSYNRDEVMRLVKKCCSDFPNKTIWLYTGLPWEEIKDIKGIELIDVIAEGRFVEELKDNNLKWVGSSNQRVIDVKKSLEIGSIVLHA
ncbi:MAG: anaerobic ribonucleoside-triphosphate reductase activating protein [Candidatus Gastranaerophilales bacterium]|nr:anaerobic ribonucleoside-triphosphate reductase activating protein [Candidatus Gastranaerophilales bacterium]